MNLPANPREQLLYCSNRKDEWMPHLRVPAALTLLAAAVLPLTACAPPDHTLEDGTHVIVAEQVSDLQMLAMIEGVLVELDGCVGIDSTFDMTFPIIFPAGTTVEGDLIRVPGFDEPFALGDSVSGGGGTIPMEDFRPDLTCRSDHIVELNPGDAD